MAAVIQWLLSLAEKMFKCCCSLLDCSPDDDDDDVGSDVPDIVLWSRPIETFSFGQFSFAMVQSNTTIEDEGHVEAGPHGLFVGIYDGHGGFRASNHCYERLFPHFTRIAQESGSISENTLRDAIAATERGFLDAVRMGVETDPNFAATGSCCLLVLVWKGTLYFANLGDSRAVIGRFDDVSNKIIAEPLNKDDNVRLPEVREELKAAHPEDPQIVRKVRGSWRVKGKIQVSKAIGDAYLKIPEYSGITTGRYRLEEPIRRAVLRADPSLGTRILQPDERFLICASDGLWDHISNQRAAEIVHKHPREGIAGRLLKAAIKVACRKDGRFTYDELKLHGSSPVRRSVHDDITIVVIFFEHGRGYDTSVPGLSIRGFKDPHLQPRFDLQGVA